MNQNINIPPSNSELTIFVNTSDNFEDCWDPFFKLFNEYWPDCPYPIVLNTETKDYSYPGLHIICSKVAELEERRLGWSECLIRALDKIQTPYILYVQEDYFLEAPVKVSVVNKLLDEMRSGMAEVIQLQQASQLNRKPGDSQNLILEVSQKAKWRLSLQAAIWKKSILRSQVRTHEDPWQFESYGALRSRRMQERIYSINGALFSGLENEVFPYKVTGIIGGKWVGEIVKPLFSKHDINVDFSKRGFYEKGRRKKRKSFVIRVVDRLRSLF
jgi:hypothetical protein